MTQDTQRQPPVGSKSGLPLRRRRIRQRHDGRPGACRGPRAATAGIARSVVNVPVLKPLDTSTVLDVAAAAQR